MKKTVFTLAATLFSAQVLAGGILPYSHAKFDELQKAGQPVLVDAHADWCPVCRRQDAVIRPLLQEPSFKDLTVLKIDYDKQKQELARFRISSQSTLVLFHRGQEVRRGVGETRPEALRRFLSLPR
ncbi:thioredoxin family protein [Neisseria shayeganii]|uniref:Thioredoxin n=1 Tax=Neisseria shayeganii 871 TaxID=1032488 RepID=G4CIU7_9NEIS|nr:thioredoxin family protein [Neisseria shayeganii]EGY52240.1 thioredoxin [Neisseria shayeganii 871]